MLQAGDNEPSSLHIVDGSRNRSTYQQPEPPNELLPPPCRTDGFHDLGIERGPNPVPCISWTEAHIPWQLGVDSLHDPVAEMRDEVVNNCWRECPDIPVGDLRPWCPDVAGRERI